MATSVVPTLLDALYAACTAAIISATVYDGVGVTSDPGDFLMLGVDWFSPDTPAVEVQQTPGPCATTRPRDETGEIVSSALSWNGDGDPKAARDAVYTILAAVENLLRANPDLDVSNVLWTGAGSSLQFRQEQDDSGAYALLVFRISFRARI